MRTSPSLVCAVGLVLASAMSARAANPPEVRALLDRAITALGGEENLARFQSVTVRGQGKLYSSGKAVDYTSQRTVQLPLNMRVAIDMTLNGKAVKLISVLSETSGWLKVNDNVQPMDKETLAEEQELFHAGRVTTLVPLRSPDYNLAIISGAPVGDRPVVGIRVSHKNHRDVDLYLDRDSALLLKSETRMKDAGKEVMQEVLYANYHDTEGARRPTKITVKRGGKVYVEEEILEYHLLERVDASLFTRP